MKKKTLFNHLDSFSFTDVALFLNCHGKQDIILIRNIIGNREESIKTQIKNDVTFSLPIQILPQTAQNHLPTRTVNF